MNNQEIALLIVALISVFRIGAAIEGPPPSKRSFVMAHITIICACFVMIARL